ncbi:unnamed protein product [Closterium sp. Naga37s-1]|nr:unnamed protein product [Closterium sp. Naga37s-1]
MMSFRPRPTEASSLVASARFLHNELPIRFAHRIAELDHLPHGLSHMPHVLKVLEWYVQSFMDPRSFPEVREWYVQSFMDLRNFPEVQGAEEEVAFTRLIERIKTRHNHTVPCMALGIAELKKRLQEEGLACVWGNKARHNHTVPCMALGIAELKKRLQVSTRKGRRSWKTGHGGEGDEGVDNPWLPMDKFPEVHQFLDRFFLSRIGIRMLIGQQIALHKTGPGRESMIGLIDTKCRPFEVARNAIDDARTLCSRTYGNAPEVHVFGDPTFTFPYVRTHLHHMLFELLKNSLRAVQERFPDTQPPPVRVVVADGIEDVAIKVSDEGGGIKRSGLPRIWSYLYSTASIPTPLRQPPNPLNPSEPQPPSPAPSGPSTPGTSPPSTPSSPSAISLASSPASSAASSPRPSRFTPIGSSFAEPWDLTEENGGVGVDEVGDEVTVSTMASADGEELPSVIAGYGYGLPIARLYARYFGGDLQIFSMEGYGTDAYLHLNRLSNVQEPLP